MIASLTILPVFFATLVVAFTSPSSETSDFVIVGGGTAVCVLAGRLCAALPNASIILLERGSPREEDIDFLVRTPRNAGATWSDFRVSEVYDSEPNRGLLGRTSPIITGKTLGGSSSINGMQWSLPIDGTIDRWDIAGLSSRNWKKYLRRVYRTAGFGQPPKSLQQIYTADYITAAERAGFPEDRQPFSDQRRDGAWLNRLSIDSKARRVDSCSAYVSPVLGTTCSRNLRIIQSATVTRVLLDLQTPPRAYGVEYLESRDEKSTKRKILDSKEVLVSAGPFESPKLLQLSGIGPRDVLKKANVPLRVDLAVGTKSQARAANALLSSYSGVPLDPASNETLLNSVEEREKWERGEGGVLGIAGSAINAIMNKIGYFTAGFGPAAPDFGSDLPILTSSCIINAKSFGHVRIRDNNPFSPPSVQLNVLGKTSEVTNLLSCIRRLRDIYAQFSPRFHLTELYPGPEDLSEMLMRNTSVHPYHFVGGCSVGTTVNQDLEVKGVRGMRVIDASVFKSMPTSAGPLASTYMLAEFMAERLSQIYKP